MLRPRTIVLGVILLAAGLAGCLADAGDDPSPASAGQAPSTFANETAPRLIPVQAEGTLPAGAHVDGRTAPAGSFDRWFELEIPGVVTHAEITMTWDAVNPTMETLLLGFGPREGSGDNARARPTAVHVTGASPLTLTVDGINWMTHDYVVWAWWDPQTEPQASAVDQPFSIEGTVTQVPG